MTKHQLPDLRRVACFAAIAGGGSIAQAAARMHVSRSVLSREIQALEQSLGKTLFVRTGRGMTLSDFGRQLLPDAQALIAETQRFSEAAAGHRGRLAGKVTIGLPGSAFPLLAPRLLREVAGRLPEVSLRMVEGRGTVIDTMLNSGEIEIGLLYRMGAEGAQEEVLLSSTRMVLVGALGDPVTATRFVRPSTVAELAVLVPSRPHIVRRLLDECLAPTGRKPHVRCEVDSLLALREMAAHGLGPAICLDHAIAGDVAAGRLQATPVTGRSLSAVLAMRLAAKNVLRESSRAVARIVAEVSRRLVQEGQWRPPRVP